MNLISTDFSANLLHNRFVLEVVNSVSKRLNIPPFDLRVKTLMHLPRFQPESLIESKDLISNEVERLGEIIAKNYSSLGKRPYSKIALTTVADYEVRCAKTGEVEMLIGKLHYLGSVRNESLNLALVNRQSDMAIGIVSLSMNDLNHINIDPYSSFEAMVVSRVYTLNEAPYNANSYFIGLAIKWIRLNLPNVKVLITYLNRNLGFTGTLYKSTNWKLLALELNVRYNYYNSNYVTDRFLLNKFGTANEMRLEGLPEISFSKSDLLPLEIYYFPVKEKSTTPFYQEVNIKRD